MGSLLLNALSDGPRRTSTRTTPRRRTSTSTNLRRPRGTRSTAGEAQRVLEQSAATLEPFPDGTTISGTWVNGRCTIVVDISTREDGGDTDDDGGGSRQLKKRRTAEGSGRGMAAKVAASLAAGKMAAKVAASLVAGGWRPRAAAAAPALGVSRWLRAMATSATSRASLSTRCSNRAAAHLPQYRCSGERGGGRGRPGGGAVFDRGRGGARPVRHI